MKLFCTMNKLLRALGLATILLLLPLVQFGQEVKNHSIELDLVAIENPDMRYCLLSNLVNDDTFLYTIDEENNSVLLFCSAKWSDHQFQAHYDAVKADALQSFNTYLAADKTAQGELFTAWKESLPQDLYVLLFKIMLMENPINRDGNQTCATSDPFCTTDVVTFHVEANPGGSCENGPYYGCLSSYTQRPPFWFHMKIGVAGAFTIRMTNSANVDIDYCCWGPFTDPVTPCPNQLTQSKYIDCGSSGAATETCLIPSTAQVGQYYIMVITKYNTSTPTDITFQKVTNSGPGETDCGILPPLVDNDGPYCVGQSIHLTGNGQAGASYSWTGPNGFTSNQQNPVINNCNLGHAGSYTCTISVGSQSSNASTQVQVFANPTANFTATTVCKGNPTQFSNTSTSNPSGQSISYQWNFGDGQTSNQTNPTHTYANSGNYTVTLTASCGNGACTSTKTQSVTVTPMPVANAGSDITVDYGSTAQLHGSGGTGTFNYHWEPANKVENPNAQNTQTVALTANQTFTLTVSSTDGNCSSTDQVTVLVNGSAMTASASASPSSICQGQSTQLHATVAGGTGNYTYAWTPTTGLSAPNTQSPTAQPSQTTTYTCRVSDGQTTQNVTVTVTVNLPEQEDITEYICPDEVFDFYGTPCTDEGNYEYHTTTAQGCDKTIILHLHHYPEYDQTVINENICYGESYFFYGVPYNYTCHIPHTDQTIHGCDSIVTLNLNVYPANDTILIDPSICIGQSYEFHGESYSQDGQVAYWDTVDNHGCLLVEKLLLSVGQYQMPPIDRQNICYAHDASPEFYWDKTGRTYTEDTYDEIILPDPLGGCDVKHRLELKFHQEFYNEQSITACDSYTWPITNETYHNTNHHIVKTFNHNVAPNFICDSTYVLDLTINRSYEGDKVVSKQCDQYEWHFGWDGETYTFTEPGNYTKTIETSLGCDSTVTLKLQMDYNPDFSRVEGRPWVVGGSEFQFSIEKYWVKPNPNATHNTTWFFGNPGFNKWDLIPYGPNNDSCLVYIYTFERDSIELCARTTSPVECGCGTFTHSKWIHCSYSGLDDNILRGTVDIFPNPNDGNMTLSFDNMIGEVDLKVYDVTGTLVDHLMLFNATRHQTHPYHTAKLNHGVYFFTLATQEGTVTKKVVIFN